MSSSIETVSSSDDVEEELPLISSIREEVSIDDSDELPSISSTQKEVSIEDSDDVDD